MPNNNIDIFTSNVSGAELVLLIDRWFHLLGSLFLAEYLDTGAPNPTYNRYFFYLLEQQKPITIGQWVAIGRLCQTELKKKWQSGRPLPWQELAVLDFGYADNKNHPMSQLIAYRNAFCHGSFDAVNTDISSVMEHIKTVFSKFAIELTQQPLRLIQEDGSETLFKVEWDGGLSQLSDEVAPHNFPVGTVYTRLDSGEPRVLSPIFRLTMIKGQWTLAMDQKKQSLEPEYAQRFQANLERYRLESQGNVEFSPEEVPKDPKHSEHIIVNGLEVSIQTGQILTLITYRPGVGLHRLAAHIWHKVQIVGSTIRLWHVVRNVDQSHPGGSGKVFAKAILRAAEKALDKPRFDLEQPDVELIDSVISATKILNDADKKVIFIVMNAHSGRIPRANDDISVLDVCKAVAFEGSGLRIMLLDTPRITDVLPHDDQPLAVTLPDLAQLDTAELADAIENWCQSYPLRRLLLNTLLNAEQSGACFEEQLYSLVHSLQKATGAPIFAPSVEHGLWSATSFLQRDSANGPWTIPGGKQGDYAQALRNVLHRNK
jgi:hypothetical protein